MLGRITALDGRSRESSASAQESQNARGLLWREVAQVKEFLVTARSVTSVELEPELASDRKDFTASNGEVEKLRDVVQTSKDEIANNRQRASVRYSLSVIGHQKANLEHCRAALS